MDIHSVENLCLISFLYLYMIKYHFNCPCIIFVPISYSSKLRCLLIHLKSFLYCTKHLIIFILFLHIFVKLFFVDIYYNFYFTLPLPSHWFTLSTHSFMIFPRVIFWLLILIVSIFLVLRMCSAISV